MTQEYIKIAIIDHIAVLTFNCPPANAWCLGAIKSLDSALNRFRENKNIRVLVLTGSGDKCFSAGFDVSDHENARESSQLGQDVWRKLDMYSKPVIAAINGHALGGGLELALGCHFRIMAGSPRARLGLTELNLGIIPGWGGTQRLSRLVGRSKALDMILLSRRVTAAEALETGLVDKIVAPAALMDTAMAFARELATRPPMAVSCVLDAMTAGMYQGLGEGLRQEARGAELVAGSKDAIEGFTAFFEKRAPLFTGE